MVSARNVLFLLLCAAISAEKLPQFYTNIWAVELHEHMNDTDVDAIAESMGFINYGKIIKGTDIYEFYHEEVEVNSTETGGIHHYHLNSHEKIKIAKQQVFQYRPMNNIIPQKSFYDYSTTESFLNFPYQPAETTPYRPIYNYMTTAAPSDRPYQPGSYNPNLEIMTDPLWDQAWFLNRGGEVKGNLTDMNVIEAWNLGYTGQGVVVSVVDNGVQTDHPDLIGQYDEKASYDAYERDDDPTPSTVGHCLKYGYNSFYEKVCEYMEYDTHGTNCAGLIAASPNNSKCSTGIAYGVKFGGIRLLSDAMTDVVEARALDYHSEHVDIYSNSYGPSDAGNVVAGPEELSLLAFKKGIENGREGKGNIYVFAGGNGGDHYDSCAADGYQNLPYTITVNAVTEHNRPPGYAEKCTNILASTYSSGEWHSNDHMIVTTDWQSGCQGNFSGTSAATAIAAGVLALTLSANKELTWRDVQHITVLAANKHVVYKSGDFVKNGAALSYSDSFGFGLMDAGAMVKLALNWTNVPEMITTSLAAKTPLHDLSDGHDYDEEIKTNSYYGCQTRTQPCYIEYVILKVTASCKRRGNMQIYLTSPSNTRLRVLPKRLLDDSDEGFNAWEFLSVGFWGEPTWVNKGSWHLQVSCGYESTYSYHTPLLTKYELTVMGTTSDPYPSALTSSKGINRPPPPDYVAPTPGPATPPTEPFWTKKTTPVYWKYTNDWLSVFQTTTRDYYSGDFDDHFSHTIDTDKHSGGNTGVIIIGATLGGIFVFAIIAILVCRVVKGRRDGGAFDEYGDRVTIIPATQHI